MKMNMNRKSIFGLMIAISLTGASSVSHADQDNAPGSMCVATGGSQLNVRSNGELENASAAAVTAVCPAERNPAWNDFSATVWVRDRHTVEAVCCRVMSKNPGGAVVAGEQVCTTGSSSGYKTLSVPAIRDAFSFSHFYVECTLPAAESGRSAILTYRSVQS